MAFFHNVIWPQMEAETATCDPYHELMQYLESPLVAGVHDPVKWWGVSDCISCQNDDLTYTILATC